MVKRLCDDGARPAFGSKRPAPRDAGEGACRCPWSSRCAPGQHGRASQRPGRGCGPTATTPGAWPCRRGRRADGQTGGRAATAQPPTSTRHGLARPQNGALRPWCNRHHHAMACCAGHTSHWTTGRQDERTTGRQDDRTTGRQDDRTTGPKPTVMHPTHHTADGCLDSTQVHAVDEDFLGLPLAGTLAVDETQTAEPSLGCPPPTGWPRARFWLSSGRRTCPVDVKPRHDFNLHTALRIGRPALGAMFAKGRALGLATRGVSDHGFIDPVGLRAPNNCVVTLCTPHDGHGRLMGTAHNSACNRAGPPPGRQGRCGRLYLLLRRRSSTRQQVRRQSHAGRILQCCRAAGGVVDHHHHRCAFGQAVSAIEHRAGHHQ